MPRTPQTKFTYVLAFKDRSFLMVRSESRRGWEFPGGKVESGESFEEAARREFLEESGFNVERLELLSTSDECQVFLCRITATPKIGGDNKQTKTRWFEKLPKDLAFPRDEYERILKIALDRLGR